MAETLRITLEDVRRALALPDIDVSAAQARMSPVPRPARSPDLPGEPKLAAVLVLLYPNGASPLHLALMRRTEYPGVHSGQISLPGGRCEPHETFEQAALREAREEIGVNLQTVALLGLLAPLYVPPSDFEIHPFVGYTPTRPAWQLQDSEVAEIIEMPLPDLLDEALKGSETIERSGLTYSIRYYRVGPHKVWGATAAILSELEVRLRLSLRLPERAPRS